MKTAEKDNNNWIRVIFTGKKFMLMIFCYLKQAWNHDYQNRFGSKN